MNDIEEESDEMLDELRRHNVYTRRCALCGAVIEVDVYGDGEHDKCDDCREACDGQS